MIEGRILKSPLIKLELGQQKNLTCINCKDNKLTYLEISGCPNLHSLDCSNNQLTNLNLSKNESLEHLDIRNNNFREQDLSFLSYLTRLKKLELGNDDQERIEQNIYNHFLGSLKYLQNLDKLEELNISNSDIDSGLEFLADNIKKFNCSADKRSNSKVKVVIEKLKSFGGSEGW
jgi:Leucine-rich repeat (LRR) protein